MKTGEKQFQIQKGLVSVIMANYNTPAEYLRQALDSILKQTYTNFEIIIVDDASTDDSLSVIESYCDKRITVLRNDHNIGLTKSLNKAIAVCKGEFIARMDLDDISEPDRFEKQIRYLQTHPKVIVCGTWAKLFGKWEKFHSSNTLCRTIPDRETYKVYQLFGNHPNIVHISAMFNHALLKQEGITYDERYLYAQDYRMWISCNEKYDCYIIPEFLVNYRVRDGAISVSRRKSQEECVFKIIQEQLDKLHLKLTDEMKPYHILLLTSRKPYDIRIKDWLKKIIAANERYHIYHQRILEKLLWDKWAEICYFGLASEKGIKKKWTIIRSLPVKKYPKMFCIRMARRKHLKQGDHIFEIEE